MEGPSGPAEEGELPLLTVKHELRNGERREVTAGAGVPAGGAEGSPAAWEQRGGWRRGAWLPGVGEEVLRREVQES